MSCRTSTAFALFVLLLVSPRPVWRRTPVRQTHWRKATSTPVVPQSAPPWSMSPWMWEDDVNTAAAVWDLVDGCRDHDLPLGTIMLDSPWATRYNSFRFDEQRYPDPQGMIDKLHQRDIRIVLWMTNIINTAESLSDAPGDDEDLYSIGKRNGYFINDGATIKWWKGKGGMIDYTNPKAVAWWHRLMDRTLSLGIDGWKLDGSAELFIMTGRKTSRGVLSWRDYVDLYYRDTLNYSRATKSDFVTMARSVDIANSTGIDWPHAPLDAAPMTWTGDQRHTWRGKGINEAIRSGFRALERGYPSVSSDTGGYQSAPQEQNDADEVWVDGMPRLLYLRGAVECANAIVSDRRTQRASTLEIRRRVLADISQVHVVTSGTGAVLLLAAGADEPARRTVDARRSRRARIPARRFIARRRDGKPQTSPPDYVSRRRLD